MGMYVTDGKIHIGYEMIEGIRKKPCICVREGNVCHVLGTFKNKDDAVFFMDKLAGLIGVKESGKE